MKCPICGFEGNLETHLREHVHVRRELTNEELDELQFMDRFMVYGVHGKSVMVETKAEEPFEFHCSGKDCGEEIVLRGTIRVVEFSEYVVVKAISMGEIHRFAELVEESLPDKPLIFEGELNGKKVKLPAETMRDFSRRFLSMEGSYYVI